jgi:hypothetical protein
MRYQSAEEIEKEIEKVNSSVFSSIKKLQESSKDEKPDTTQIEPQIKSLYSETKSLILLVEKNQIMLDHIRKTKDPYSYISESEKKEVEQDRKKLKAHQKLRQACIQKLEDILGLIEDLNQEFTPVMTATEKTLSDYKKKSRLLHTTTLYNHVRLQQRSNLNDYHTAQLSLQALQEDLELKKNHSRIREIKDNLPNEYLTTHPLDREKKQLEKNNQKLTQTMKATDEELERCADEKKKIRRTIKRQNKRFVYAQLKSRHDIIAPLAEQGHPGALKWIQDVLYRNIEAQNKKIAELNDLIAGTRSDKETIMGLRSHRDPAEWKGELTKQIEVMLEQISVHQELHTGDKIFRERAVSSSGESVSTTEFGPFSPENQNTPKKRSPFSRLLSFFSPKQEESDQEEPTKENQSRKGNQGP